MIEEIIDKMSNLVNLLQESIKADINDIKEGKHEGLLDRNEEKHNMINDIANLKSELNQALVAKMQEGVDVNIYRTQVDELEDKLKELYESNRKLASIVLPVKQMYKELVDEITAANGGNIFDVKV